MANQLFGMAHQCLILLHGQFPMTLHQEIDFENNLHQSLELTTTQLTNGWQRTVHQPKQFRRICSHAARSSLHS